MGMVAASTETMPEGTYFSAQKSGPYSATNMSKRDKAPGCATESAVGRAWPLKTHKGVEHDAGDEEARAGGKERRQFLDGDADGEKGCAPEEVNGEEGGDHAQPERSSGGKDDRIGNH